MIDKIRLLKITNTDIVLTSIFQSNQYKQRLNDTKKNESYKNPIDHKKNLDLVQQSRHLNMVKLF